jgi:colicin import membrane protein
MEQLQLIKINAKEFGIEESKAKQISDQFTPMLDKMVELEKEANNIFSLDIEKIETGKLAKEVRLKYVKVRTGTAEIHKQQKAFYLSAGRFVDGWKNAQIFASQGIEEKLETIENYFKNKEIERLKELQNNRLELITPFLENTIGLDLSSMTEETFNNFLLGSKTNFELKLENERLEVDRLENERLAEIERQRLAEIENEKIRVENLRLQEEAKEKELEFQKERNLQIKKEADLKAKNDAILKELQNKKDAEIKAENERLALLEQQKKEAEKLAKAPIKKQLEQWVNSFELPTTNVDNETSFEIKNKFDAFKKWSINQINNL